MKQRYANVADVPLALAVFLASDFYDHNEDPNTISATTLLKPLRQIILPSRIPPGEGLPHLADMMNNRMGTAIHDGIERAWLTNHVTAMQSLGFPQKVIDRIVINVPMDQVKEDEIPIYLEQRLSRKSGKWTVTGKFDFIGEGKVQDFKTTGTYSYRHQVNAEKFALQGSLYRWLDPVMIHQNVVDIHYIFTDWKPSMVKSDPQYPPRRFITQAYDLRSVNEMDGYVRNKLTQIEKYWDAHESDLPLCDDEELWRSEPQFKYYKNGDVSSKRSTKNFDTKQEAMIFMDSSGNVGAIREVPGQVTACKYCPAFAACSQKDQLIKNGDLLMN